MDIAISWDAEYLVGDIKTNGMDIATDAGLKTAVAISLFTDRTAGAEDSPGQPWDGDRRGWWGDSSFGNGDFRGPIGSRLWLLRRGLRVTETLRRAEEYAKESLKWLVDDGVAHSVNVSADWFGDAKNQLGLTVKINRRDPTTGDANTTYDFVWEMN